MKDIIVCNVVEVNFEKNEKLFKELKYLREQMCCYKQKIKECNKIAKERDELLDLSIRNDKRARELNENLDKIYSEIVKKRDELLTKSKETSDYNFCVAHGLTEAIRCFPDIWRVE